MPVGQSGWFFSFTSLDGCNNDEINNKYSAADIPLYG